MLFRKITFILLAGLLCSTVFAADKAVQTTVAASSAASAPKAPASGMLTPKQPMYTLRLNSNRTTGYSWFLVSYPAKYLKLIKYQYLPPKAQLLGAGGVGEWQFQAKKDAFTAPRALKIKLMYVRPWEKVSPTSIQTFWVFTQSR